MTPPVPQPGAVVVVIPTLNEAANLERVLDELTFDLPMDRPVRFVVADGGSGDATCTIAQSLTARRPDLALLHNPRRLQGAAVNLAARLDLAAEILVRCDAHASYPPGYVRRLVETLDRQDATSVVTPMDSVGEACFQRAVAWLSDTPMGSGGSAHRGGRKSGFVDHGHHAAFRLDLFRQLGGYDETFSHNEDAELDCRQRSAGARIYLDADIRIEYHPRATIAGLWRQYLNYGRGRSRTVQRHPGSIRARQLAVPLHIVLCGLALAASLWAPWTLLWPAAYLAALAAGAAMIALRHESWCGLLAAPAALVMHLAWAVGFLSGFLTARERRWAPRAVAQAAQP